MDHFNRGAMPPGSEQNQSGFVSQHQPPSLMSLMSNNARASWNMVDPNTNYNSYATSGVPNQYVNSFSSYGYGANTSGPNHPIPNSLLHGLGGNTMGVDEKVGNQSSNTYSSLNHSGRNNGNFRKPLLPTPNLTGTTSGSCRTMASNTSESHLHQFGKSGPSVNQLGGSSRNFRQPLLQTPDFVGTTLDSRQTMANQSLNIETSELGLGNPRTRAQNPRYSRSTENPQQTSSIGSTISFNYTPDTNHTRRDRPMPGGSISAADSSRLGRNSSFQNTRQYGNHSAHNTTSLCDTPPNPFSSRPIPGSRQHGDNPTVLDASRFGGNRVNNSQLGGNRAMPERIQSRGVRPESIATIHSGELPVPDGTTNVKYPAPDVKNLMFDSSTGYRFDPTTGLHFDANSGLYLNNHLKVLLRWDPLTSTYVLVSNTTSGLAAPAVTLLNNTQSSGNLSAALSKDVLKALAQELVPLLKSENQEQGGPHLNTDHVMRSASLTHPSAAKRPRWSQERQISESETDLWQSREPVPRKLLFSSSPDDLHQRRNATRDRTWEDRRDPVPAGDLWDRRDPIAAEQKWGDRRDPIPAARMHENTQDLFAGDQKWGDRRDPIMASRMLGDQVPAEHMWRDRRDPSPTECMWDDRQDLISVGRGWDARNNIVSTRRSRSPARGGRRSLSRDRELSISDIHNHNLKDLGNLYGRYFPKNPSPSSFLLAAPVPSKNEMSRQDVTKYLEDAVSFDKLAFRSVRVHQGGFGAPCNYALIRFNSDDDAVYWYKVHRGIIELGNYQAANPTYLFFAEDHWICSKQRDDDKGCDTPTPNFPFRNLCYKCLELRTKLESPIMKMETPTKWIGVSQIDCTKYSSVDDVLTMIPPHRGITVESTEFLREPSGLPIGLCVFQILNREQSTRFFGILKNEKFEVSYIHLNKKALGSLTSSERSSLSGREMLLSRLGPKVNASLPAREKPAQLISERLGLKRRGTRGGRNRRRNRRPRSDPEELIENLGEQFLVVDECKESENNEEKKESKPFLQAGPVKPLNKFKDAVLVNKLNAEDPEKEPKPFLQPGPVKPLNKFKDAVLVHKLNAEDPDNVLHELFVEPPSLRAAVLLAPVPAGLGGDKDSVKKEIVDILKSDGIDFISVDICQGKGLGAPCNYGLIRFKKSCSSLSLYNNHKGVLHLSNGTNDKLKAFMYFSDKNWQCLQCNFLNFPLRSWCNKCFKNRSQLIFSPISATCAPTQFLGISSIGLPLDMAGSDFKTDIILASLPEEESNRVVSCRMMLEDKGLPGLCVLEAKDSKDCENLLKHFQSTGWTASFLVMNEETSDMEFVKSTGTDDVSSIAQPKEKGTVQDYQDSSKYDPMKYIFDNSKPSQCIILSPAPAINWDKVKQQIDNLLAEDGVNYSCSYVACRPEECGSPHDYIQINFTDLEEAESWFCKHDGSVELVFPGKQKDLKFKMCLYYSEDAWRCRVCLTTNFPARSLCHKCYAHRNEDGFTPVTISKTPTKWVGISCLRQTINNVDQVKQSLPLLDSFKICRMHLIKEPNPLLHVGLCIIETPSKEDGLNLAVYIQNHQAWKYEAKSMKVIFVNFERQHNDLDASTIESSSILMDSDDTASYCHGNYPPDNHNLYWQKMMNGVEGEDVLKKYFQDQFIMPLPAGNSVFVQLPSMREIVGSAPASQFRRIFVSLLEKSGVNYVTAERAKLYSGMNLGAPCNYTILTFNKATDADEWRAKHSGKWVFSLEDGSKWVSFLHPCNPNWKCKRCSSPNFPLRIHCCSCFESRDGGAPALTKSDSPTRFVGITKFQKWCANEEILFNSVKIIDSERENKQLKKVHYPTEPSGISLGLCLLEFENIAVAKNAFARLVGWTSKKTAIAYVDTCIYLNRDTT